VDRLDSEKLHFFGFIGGQEGEHRGRFDATGLREGGEEGFTGGRRTPFGEDQIFLFF